MKTKQYEMDLKLLLKLSTAGVKARNDFRRKMSDEHGVSLKTIYRDEKLMSEGKFVLGRKVRDDRGKLKVKPSRRAVKLMKELKESGRTFKESVPIITSITGEKISDRTKGKIAKKIIKEVTDIASEMQDEGVSEFGDEFKLFLEKYFKLDLIAPQKGIGLRFGKYKFVLQKHEVRDILMILGNAYNNSGVENKMKIDRVELLKIKIYHLLEEHIRMAEARMDTKQLESITRQYNMLREKDREITANIKVFEKCIKEIKPDISFEEIYELIKKHSVEED